MQCDICFRTGGKEYLCATDARNALYEPRIQHAHVLLEKDALEQQVLALQAGESSDSSRSRLETERQQTLDRTEEIIAHADELRVKVEKARADLAKRKAALARRKEDMNSAKAATEPRRNRQVEEVEKSIRMTKYKWNQGHNTLAASRTFLCGEAAKLYGLKKIRRTGGHEEYKIGGVSIVDLRTLNTASPAHISTALSHIVHLLMLSTHYLSIRLPAEITLPHRDYPLPTIFPLNTSYKHSNNIPFPGTGSTPSSNNSPTASRHSDQSFQPRPRPLFVKKPLPLLASEDPSGYSLFIEAVTLLAYDVAWVCKSQGVAVGDESNFEDIYNIGKNMYNFLIAPRPRPPPSSRNSSAQSTPTKGGRESDAESSKEKATPANIMGRYSHGSAHSFLGSAEGHEFIRSWKLPSPTKLADKLKSKLMSEVANAEWEVLDQDAWAVEEDTEVGEEAVVVGARRAHEGTRGYGSGIQSFMSMRTVVDAVEVLGGEGEGDGERKSGQNGWTKLKPR